MEYIQSPWCQNHYTLAVCGIVTGLADWVRLVLGKWLVKVMLTVSLESVTKPQPSDVNAKDLLTESMSGDFNFKKYNIVWKEESRPWLINELEPAA